MNKETQNIIQGVNIKIMKFGASQQSLTLETNVLFQEINSTPPAASSSPTLPYIKSY